MDRQQTHRLAVADAAEALFHPPNSRTTPTSLESTYLPAKPSGSRPAAVAASPAATHEHWFTFGRRARLKRGTELRRGVLDRLRSEGVLLEPGNLANPGEFLLEAQLRARREGRAIYVSPGLMRAPSLGKDYSQAGWAAPGVQWANFKPALLKVEHLGGKKKNYWSVTVIGIKSSHPSAVPGKVRPLPSRSSAWRRSNPLSPFNPQLYLDEEFKLATYRFFLVRILKTLQQDASKNGQHLLARLSVARTSAMWRYTECISHTCSDPQCFLNSPLTAAQIEDKVALQPVQEDTKWLKEVLFNRVSVELGLSRKDSLTSGGVESITTGLATISVSNGTTGNKLQRDRQPEQEVYFTGYAVVL
ncbi:hypothetical protein JCM10213_008509 [Rhodosporidiobolus nylandii]